jgi:hypothetical protein
MIEFGMLSRRDAVLMTLDFDKPAGERCPHQRHHKGCAIYERRPFGCRFWNCRWLVNDDTAELSRPDRSHYVIDVSPDYITRTTADGGKDVIGVVQVWVDPKHPDAHKDKALRAYLERQAHHGHAALIRLSSTEAFTLFAPPMTGGEWIEIHSSVREAEHTVEEKLAALGSMKVTFESV